MLSSSPYTLEDEEEVKFWIVVHAVDYDLVQEVLVVLKVGHGVVLFIVLVRFVDVVIIIIIIMTMADNNLIATTKYKSFGNE